MRQVIFVLIAALVMSVSVSAGWVEDFYGIRASEIVEEEEIPECYEEFVFKEEISEWNSEPYFREGLKAFKDGYHIMHFTEAPYRGAEYYTMYKNSGRVVYIEKGFCVDEDDKYSMYSTSLNLGDTEEYLYSAYYNDKDFNAFQEGYRIMKSIDGLSPYQKLHAVRTGLRYVSSR